MLRKLIIWFIVGSVVAAGIFGYTHYAVVGFYDPDTPKVTYLYLVQKPEKSFSFFYNHIDKQAVEREVHRLRTQGRLIPWDLDGNWLINNTIYTVTLDNRNL